MIEDTRIINRILKLRFIDKLSYEKISKNLKEWKQELSQDSANDIIVATDPRTIGSICKFYELYADDYREAFANNQTDQFFEQHPRVGKRKPGGELSDEQKHFCCKVFDAFLASREKKTYYELSYTKYYQWLTENYPNEMIYDDVYGDIHQHSYATVMKYLQEWYDPNDYIAD